MDTKGRKWKILWSENWPYWLMIDEIREHMEENKDHLNLGRWETDPRHHQKCVKSQIEADEFEVRIKLERKKNLSGKSSAPKYRQILRKQIIILRDKIQTNLSIRLRTHFPLVLWPSCIYCFLLVWYHMTAEDEEKSDTICVVLDKDQRKNGDKTEQTTVIYRSLICTRGKGLCIIKSHISKLAHVVGAS